MRDYPTLHLDANQC